MSSSRVFTRREALQAAALGALALPLLDARALAAAPAVPDEASVKEDREHGLRLGIAGYTFRGLGVAEALTALKALRIKNACIYKNQLDWETATPDEARAVAEKYHAAGIALSGTGVVNLANDEAKCRRAFDNVRAAQVATMICKPDPAALPLVEKLAKEYDQRLAIHNHGPEDKLYPTPADTFNAVKSLDARLGVCIDIGHSMRAKADPIATIRQYASRLYDLHLKDSLAVPGAIADIPVEIGAGHMDIRGVLRALLDIRYRDVVEFEYEKVAANPITGLAESVGYVRGVLAAMS
jgi:sugar phosphate isomerase/epimerase